jgi:hypothetical protein
MVVVSFWLDGFLGLVGWFLVSGFGWLGWFFGGWFWGRF